MLICIKFQIKAERQQDITQYYVYDVRKRS